MKPGDTVYLNQRGSWFEYTFINAFEWQDAVQIKNGLGGMTCKASELISKEAYDKMVHEKRREELRVELGWLLNAWEDGLHTSKDIAKKTGESARSIGQKIALAKRWGLIKSDDKL